MGAALRGRFAPSPTGHLHLGNARTALLAWLEMRALGGEFWLRIEDLDASRCRPHFTDSLLRDLEFLGLHWDGPVWFQSRRQAVYEAAVQSLLQRGVAYPCICSRADIARAVTAPHGPSEEGPVYPGTCREQPAGWVPPKPASVRFRTVDEEVTFIDGLAGGAHQNVHREVGDFVIRRADGVASYQLAVVVDDAEAGMTHVTRGDDLLFSTPRQILLYRALGLSVPNFTHVPLLLDEGGVRMAKRTGAFTVTAWREAGVESERIVALLAQSAGIPAGEWAKPHELAPLFSWGAVKKEASALPPLSSPPQEK